MSSPLTASFVLSALGFAMACRPPLRDSGCVPERGVEVWVERRFPPTVQLADTAFGSLSIAVSRDSLAQRAEGSMISVVIAGPAAAELPDTVRVLSAELPSGGALWRGDQLRPGQYTAELSTQGYAAGPRTFSIAAGERVEVEARLRQRASCDPDTVRRP
ncbi:MAG TPA: hypothetical protein VFZ21_18565 [Gemmatimonadaceae bacterium]|nr:hypothetical protein [Gemmatimonadaceae bacterium]